eukprot:scaffold15700_cov81-Isochrysis_galbana.AAC.2
MAGAASVPPPLGHFGAQHPPHSLVRLRLHRRKRPFRRQVLKRFCPPQQSRRASLVRPHHPKRLQCPHPTLVLARVPLKRLLLLRLLFRLGERPVPRQPTRAEQRRQKLLARVLLFVQKNRSRHTRHHRTLAPARTPAQVATGAGTPAAAVPASAAGIPAPAVAAKPPVALSVPDARVARHVHRSAPRPAAPRSRACPASLAFAPPGPAGRPLGLLRPEIGRQASARPPPSRAAETAARPAPSDAVVNAPPSPRQAPPPHAQARPRAGNSAPAPPSAPLGLPRGLCASRRLGVVRHVQAPPWPATTFGSTLQTRRRQTRSHAARHALGRPTRHAKPRTQPNAEMPSRAAPAAEAEQSTHAGAGPPPLHPGACAAPPRPPRSSLPARPAPCPRPPPARRESQLATRPSPAPAAPGLPGVPGPGRRCAAPAGPAPAAPRHRRAP